jgi:hypothetical protein
MMRLVGYINAALLFYLPFVILDLQALDVCNQIHILFTYRPNKRFVINHVPHRNLFIGLLSLESIQRRLQGPLCLRVLLSWLSVLLCQQLMTPYTRVLSRLLLAIISLIQVLVCTHIFCPFYFYCRLSKEYIS